MLAEITLEASELLNGTEFYLQRDQRGAAHWGQDPCYQVNRKQNFTGNKISPPHAQPGGKPQRP